jgi:hypothetical protein
MGFGGFQGFGGQRAASRVPLAHTHACICRSAVQAGISIQDIRVGPPWCTALTGPRPSCPACRRRVDALREAGQPEPSPLLQSPELGAQREGVLRGWDTQLAALWAAAEPNTMLIVFSGQGDTLYTRYLQVCRRSSPARLNSRRAIACVVPSSEQLCPPEHWLDKVLLCWPA